MADEVFRLPKSSYEELVKIIRAYGSSDKEVSLPQLKQASGMHETIISSNNAFLNAMGIIEGGKVKKPTTRGRDLANALEHNLPDQIANNWRDMVLSSDFLRKMVTAVSIRQGMEHAALQSHIAYSLGEPKKSNVMAGAGAVIEILKIAGLLSDDDGKLTAKQSSLASFQSPATEFVGNATFGVDAVVAHKQSPPLSAQILAPSGISIQIQIQCSANELPELGPKLRALLEELSKAGPPKPATDA